MISKYSRLSSLGKLLSEKLDSKGAKLALNGLSSNETDTVA